MNIQDVLLILQNKLIALNAQRGSAAQAGELEHVTRLDAEIEELTLTIAKIESAA